MDFDLRVANLQKVFEKEAIANLLTDDKLASEIVTEFAGDLVDEKAIPLIRACVAGNAAEVMSRLTTMIYASIKSHAEYAAIDGAEEIQKYEEAELAKHRGLVGAY